MSPKPSNTTLDGSGTTTLNRPESQKPSAPPLNLPTVATTLTELMPFVPSGSEKNVGSSKLKLPSPVEESRSVASIVVVAALIPLMKSSKVRSSVAL